MNSLCPKCNHNDRVEKVSAIVASQTHELQGTTTQFTDYQDKDGRWHSSTRSVPFDGTQVSNLAQRLSPPIKPELGFSWKILVGKIFLGIGIVGLIPGLILFILFFFLLSSIASILVGWFLIKFGEKEQARQKPQLELEIKKWQKAIQKWNALYYCGRDDCVFIPGNNVSVPSTQMTSYIYQE